MTSENRNAEQSASETRAGYDRLLKWQEDHRTRKAKPGEARCGDVSSILRPDEPCDLPVGHDGYHESRYGFWFATTAESR